MRAAIAILGVSLGWGGGLPAQPLTVYSEFASLDAAAKVLAPETPREILSPAIARNAFSTFQIAIQVPAETPFRLRVGLNPENAVKVTLYRQTGKHAPSGGEILEKTKESGLDEPISATGPQVIWMDLWVEKDAPVRRIKVEPQLYLKDDWVIYPMEVRVGDTQVPTAVPEEPSGYASASDILRSNLCKGPPSTVPRSTVVTPDGLHYRNAMQDVQLLGQLRTEDQDELKKRIGGCNVNPPADSEAYLRVRDYFFIALSPKPEKAGGK